MGNYAQVNGLKIAVGMFRLLGGAVAGDMARLDD